MSVIQRTYKLKSTSVGLSYSEDYDKLQSIVDNWFDNQTRLTIRHSECLEYRKSFYSDGINELAINDSSVYVYSATDNFGYINFYTKERKRFFSCKIEDYNENDEINALQDYIANKQDAELKKDRELAKKEAKEEAKSNGLEELKGTQKQIEWAEQIRIRILKKMHLLLDVEKQQKLNRFMSIPCFNKATFWINNRDQYAQDFLHFIDNYDDCCDELFFQKNWKLTKADIKKAKKPKKPKKPVQSSATSRKIQDKLGGAFLNIGISNKDFITRINKYSSEFFTKLKNAIDCYQSVFIKLHVNQKFGKHEIFFIRVYDNKLTDAGIFDQMFYVQNPKLSDFIEYEALLKELRDKRDLLFSENPKLTDCYSSNLQTVGLKISKELEDLNQQIAYTKEAYLDAIPLDEKQQIQKIFDVVIDEYGCNVELVSEQGLVSLFCLEKIKYPL